MGLATTAAAAGLAAAAAVPVQYCSEAAAIQCHCRRKAVSACAWLNLTWISVLLVIKMLPSSCRKDCWVATASTLFALAGAAGGGEGDVC